jgi:hypothetical protein
LPAFAIPAPGSVCFQDNSIEKLFFAHCCATPRPFSGPGIRFGSLSIAGKSATVTTAPVTPQVHQPFDIHGDFATAIAFNDIIVLYNDPDSVNVIAAQIVTVHLVRQIGLIQDLARGS